MREHWARSALTALGIAIGAAVLVAMTLTNDAISRSFSAMGDVLGRGADVVVRGGEPGVDPALAAEVAAVPGVRAVAPLVIEQALLTDESRLMIIGADFFAGDPMAVFGADEGAVDGMEDPLIFANDPSGLLIAAPHAKTRQLKKGDPVEVLTSKGPYTLRVRGVIHADGLSELSGGAVGVMAIDIAKQVFSRTGRVDRIDVRLDNPSDAPAVMAKLAEKLDGRAIVERPSDRGEQLAAMTGAMTTGLTLGAFAALLVGLFVVYQTLSFAVARRRREIATWRAVGASSRRVAALILAQAFVLALTGVLVGIPLGAFLSQFSLDLVASSVSAIYTLVSPPAPELTLLAALGYAALILAAALSSALLPALRAARTPPALVFASARSTEVASRGGPVWRLAAGGLLMVLVAGEVAAWERANQLSTSGYLALALVLIGTNLCAPAVVTAVAAGFRRVYTVLFGDRGRLAADALSQDVGRASGTAAALMYGLALYIGISTLVTSFEAAIDRWIDRAVPADVAVTLGSPLADMRNVPLQTSLDQRLTDLPELERLVHVRLVPVPVGTLDVLWLSVEADRYLARARPIVLQGEDPLSPDAFVRERVCVINESLHVRAGLGVGQTVSMPTPDGAMDFRIAAVVQDFTSDQGFVLTDRRWYMQAYDDPLTDTFHLQLKPGADPVKVRDAVRARLKDVPQIRVSTQEELLGQVRAVMQSAFAVTKALELIAVLIAVFGIINTMTAQVLDRRRVFGLLRAVGATGRQVAMLVVLEAVALGVSAVLLGAGAGLVFGRIFTEEVIAGQTTWQIPLLFPTGPLIEASVLAVLVAGLAGLWPARTVAKQPPLDAFADG